VAARAARGVVARTLAVLAVAFVGSACGSQPRVEPQVVRRLPHDARQAVYEAENDVVIAKNHRDEARLEIARLRAERDAARAQWEHSQERLKKAGAGDRVGGARHVLDARLSYVSAEEDAADAALDRADVEVDLARARAEQVRFAQAVRYGIAPEAQLAGFDEEVKKLDDAARAAEKKQLDLHANAIKAFEVWKQAAIEYARTTKDFDTGVWLE
jgi:hypothetical protein